MSIDLGNEFMKIGIVSPGKPMETVLNTDSARKTAMAVAFRDGQRFFGEAALSVGIRFPEKIYTRLLDLIGKPLNHPIVQKYMKQFPYHNITANANNDGLLLTHPEGDVFTPEELLAMVLERARIYSEHFLASEIAVKSAVIVVPSFVSQAERLAILNSGKIAGLNVLQLINGNTAVALNYGLFRINDFSIDKPKNIIFYDMGSASTEVTVASFQLRKKNEGAYPTTVPELTIRSIGFDRSLGGFEMQLRLRDHLVKLFVEQHGTKDKRVTLSKVQENKRAMSKLLKEAGRVKVMLSANNEIQARVENVMNDLDLKVPLTRTDYEEICGDLLTSRVIRPLENALHLSGITTQEIEQVVLFGGNTRTPSIQKSLLEFLSGHELSKNVNSDEAASLGGAYLAAGLSKGFRVKSFDIREFNLFPITVEFDRVTTTADESGKTKKVQRVLFAKGNSYPVRKVITFNKNTQDFSFNVNYGDLSFLDATEQLNVGSKRLFSAETKNLRESIAQYKNNEQYESKGIKAHFYMDPNGILRLEKVEYAVNERIEVTVEGEPEPSGASETLSGLGNKITNFFSAGNESNIVRDTLSNLGEQNSSSDVTSSSNGAETNDRFNSNSGEKVSNLFNQGQGNESEVITEEVPVESGDEKPVEPFEKSATPEAGATNESSKTTKKEIKLKPIKVPVNFNLNMFHLMADDDSVARYVSNLQMYSEKERELLQQEQIKNSFESFLVETKAKLYDGEYEQASTEQEREKYIAKLSEASEWLEYESDSAKISDFEEKLKVISAEFEALFSRVHEHSIRPEALNALDDFLNKTDQFLSAVSNLKDDDDVFTEVEISTLQKLVDETKQWRQEKDAEQSATPLYETPKLVSKDIQEKIGMLDRELKYLYNKQQLAAQKKRLEKLAEKKKAEKEEAEAKANAESEGDAGATKDDETARDNDQDTLKTVEDEQLSPEAVPLAAEEVAQDSKSSDYVDGLHTEL